MSKLDEPGCGEKGAYHPCKFQPAITLHGQTYTRDSAGRWTNESGGSVPPIYTRVLDEILRLERIAQTIGRNALRVEIGIVSRVLGSEETDGRSEES